jgi:hypothetical protein
MEWDPDRTLEDELHEGDPGEWPRLEPELEGALLEDCATESELGNDGFELEPAA